MKDHNPSPITRQATGVAAKSRGEGSGATMTLNLSAREMEIVEAMAADHEMSKTALIRQALRVYQIIQARLKDGETLRFSGDHGRALLFIGPGFDPLSHQPPRAPDEPGDRAREAGKFRSIPDGDA